jgi:hypothetical protein
MVDHEPCSHPGCLNHVSHPCEGCGRTAGVRREGAPNTLTLETLHNLKEYMRKQPSPIRYVLTQQEADDLSALDPCGKTWVVGEGYYLIEKIPETRKILFLCCSHRCIDSEVWKLISTRHGNVFRQTERRLTTPTEDICFMTPQDLPERIMGREFHELRQCGNVYLDHDARQLIKSRIRLK